MAERSHKPADWASLWASGDLGKFLILCFGVWLHASNSNFMATLLPIVVDDLGGVTLVNWTGALYEIGSILAGVLAGFMVRGRGLGPAAIAAAASFAAGSALAAAAPGMPVLLAGRLLQGIGGGGMIALTLIAIRRMFPASIWPQLIAIESAIWGASALSGPFIGALFAAYADWRSGFWFFSAQAVILVFLLRRVLLGQTGEAAAGAPGTPPVMGLALLTGGIVMIAAAGVDIHIVRSPLLIAAGVALLTVFLRQDGRGRAAALLPSNPFAISTDLGAGMIVTVTLCMSITAFTLYGPLVMAVLYDASPLVIGYTIVLGSVGWTLAAIVFAKSGPVLERMLIRGGAILVMITNVGFAWILPNGPLLALLPLSLLEGAAIGACWGFIIRRIVSAAPEAEKDLASSAVTAVQRTGFALGAAVCGLVANWAGFADNFDEDSARNAGFWVFFAFIPVAGIGTIAAFKMAAQPLRLPA